MLSWRGPARAGFAKIAKILLTSSWSARRTIGVMVARLVVMGVALGGALATGVALALRGLLVGVGTLDPVSYGGAALLCAAALAAASWGPASRAVATDPALALRAE